AYNPNWPGGLALQTWYLPFPYGTEAYFQVSHFNVSAFITAEAQRIGFLENSMSLIFVSSIVQTETNQQFNWPLIAVA
ncbi:hypothetical protein KGZ17_32660, partial [Pseudomonas aeruginosa]|nr:hypothetical protein [Pseudomonas aeruginosa]